MGLVLRNITAVGLVSFSGLSAQVVRSEQTGTPFTLRAYPARWVLSGEGDTLIVPNVRLADLAGKSWEVVVLKNGERGCIISPQAIFTEAEIHSATSLVGTGSDKSLLEVQLNPEGTKALSTYSSRETNIGRPIAIRYDNRWISFPQLLAHIPVGRIIVSGLTAREVEAITATLESRRH